MSAVVTSWFLGFLRRDGDKGASTLLRRWALVIFLLILICIPVFGWVQYRQAHALERLTDQSFSSFEWDAFKLELRMMSLRNALLEALMRPESPQLAVQASTQYNLFAGQVALMERGISREAMADQPIFQTVLSQAQAFLQQADPVLEEASARPDDPVMRPLLEQAGSLQANIHRLVIEAHDLRFLRSTQMIKEVQGIGHYSLALSAVAVILGCGWGVSAMRNLAWSSRRQQELQALYLKSSFNASHDFLTGLANRRLLYDQLQHAIASSRRNNTYGAVILIDLDNFKPINDTYGHDAGDMLLVEAANRMKKCVRDVDTVARLGGDEFAVLLGQVDGQKDHASDTVSMISRKLLDTLSAPYQLTLPGEKAQPAAIRHVCSASFGVAVFGRDAPNADQIIQAADVAMYRAKRNGGNQIETAA